MIKILKLTAVAGLFLVSFAAQHGSVETHSERLFLAGSRIQIPPKPPRYVLKALGELRTQLQPPASQTQTGPRQGTSILVRIVQKESSVLGEEGFRITAQKNRVEIEAASWRGAHYALLDLVRLLAESPDGHSIPAGLNSQQRPSFELRGMYAHTAWVYNSPFALRSWKLADWKRYVDLLAYMKVNLLQIWNLVSIMPQPLSAQDTAYLKLFDEVARYAREERGFRAVWLGDAANNVALPSTEPIQEREYYIVHSLRNPGIPEQLREIAQSRRSLYQLNPSADGYWVIDSDPGGWPGSSADDFVSVLKENRKLIDELAQRKQSAELIYWIWHGWGTRTKAEDLTHILKSLEQSPGRSMGYLACFPEDLKIARDLGLGEKTVWFPYGAIEGEPSSPYTGLRFDMIRKAVKSVEGQTPLRGIMGNAQTPLVQLPNLWLFHNSAWDDAFADQSDSAVLESLARSVYPQISADLAKAWSLLTQGNSREVRAMADRLQTMVLENRLGPAAVVGRFVSSDSRWLVSNLASQLAVHALALELIQSLKDLSSLPTVEVQAEQYLKAALKMAGTTGFRPALNKKRENLLPFFNWFYSNTDYQAIRAAWNDFQKKNTRAADGVLKSLKQKYPGSPECRVCPEMVEFLAGDPPKRAPDFKYAN